MEIRNGDKVLVRLTVKDEEPMRGIGVVCINSIGSEITALHADIVSVESRPVQTLQIGDRVTWLAGGLVGEVAMVADGEACVAVTGSAHGEEPCPVIGSLVKHPVGAFRLV